MPRCRPIVGVSLPDKLSQTIVDGREDEISDPQIPGKVLMLTMGFALAVTSFAFGGSLTSALMAKSTTSPSPFWLAGLLGVAAVLSAINFVLWVRKLP